MHHIVKWEKACFHADDEEDGHTLIPYIRLSSEASNGKRMLISMIVSSEVSTIIVSARCLVDKTIVTDLTVYESHYNLTISPTCSRVDFNKFLNAIKAIRTYIPQNVMIQQVFKRLSKVVPKARCEWKAMQIGKQKQIAAQTN